jgi:hypothetical protein
MARAGSGAQRAVESLRMSRRESNIATTGRAAKSRASAAAKGSKAIHKAYSGPKCTSCSVFLAGSNGLCGRCSPSGGGFRADLHPRDRQGRWMSVPGVKVHKGRIRLRLKPVSEPSSHGGRGMDRASALREGERRKIEAKLRLIEAEDALDEQVAIEAAERFLSEAADKTPEPFSTSKTSNWVARAGGLPNYVQHVAHDLMEKRGMSESRAIATAINVMKRWCRGGGDVKPDTRAAACKALAQWESMKAKAHAS